jgi:CRP/FNR family transcriptional regulator
MERGPQPKSPSGGRRDIHPASELDIIESSLDLAHREETVFQNLSTGASEELSAITLRKSYSSGTRLFAFNEPALGIFIISTGRVALLAPLMQGKTLSLSSAGPGDILGLVATLAGKPHRASAQTREACEIKFIPKAQLMEFLAKHGGVALRISERLCETYEQALQEMRAAGLRRTVAGRLARLLLDWPSRQGEAQGQLHIEVPLTHEGIAQIIGVRRETVSRIINDFKRMGLIRIQEQTIFIPSRAALELIANS